MRIASSPASSTTPIPRCPPPFHQYAMYAARLDRMSVPDLNSELSKQKMRLFAAEHGFRGDPVAARDARAKIALCEKELASRKLNPYGEYARQVNKMSNKELSAEIKSQQQRLWASQHGIRYDPVTEKDAMAKLKILSAEAAERRIKVPPLLPFGVR